jgi:uncharacterized protein
MWHLLSSVLLASLLGSLHCVAMCGPLLGYCVAPNGCNDRTNKLAEQALYHGGRWLAYIALGGLAGALGNSVDRVLLRSNLGIGAALLSGGVVSVWALQRLRRRPPLNPALIEGQRLLGRHGRTQGELRHVYQTARATVVHGVRRLQAWAATRSGAARSLTIGLASGLLPCGWLYAFVVLAIGTADPISGALTLSAFWLGSVPALASLGVVSQRLLAKAGRFGRVLPTLAVVLTSLLTIVERGRSAALEPCHATSSPVGLEAAATESKP